LPYQCLVCTVEIFFWMLRPNGLALSCRTDNFQNVLNETGFHAENNINKQ